MEDPGRVGLTIQQETAVMGKCSHHAQRPPLMTSHDKVRSNFTLMAEEQTLDLLYLRLLTILMMLYNQAA